MELRLAAATAAVLLLSGCATVLNDSTHQMRIDTVTEDGQLVAGSDCTVRNDKSTAQVKSGEPFQVRRSAKDLEIECVHPGYPEATGHAVSRANAGMWGNVLAGGVVGAIVDHNKGTAYTYPTWVQLVFGWAVTLDRHDEESGAPLVGTRVSKLAPVATGPAVTEPTATTAPAPTAEEPGKTQDQPKPATTQPAPIKWQYKKL